MTHQPQAKGIIIKAIIAFLVGMYEHRRPVATGYLDHHLYIANEAGHRWGCRLTGHPYAGDDFATLCVVPPLTDDDIDRIEF